MIKSRKECGAWFSSCTARNSFNSANESHQHFIEILEDVRNILSSSNKSCNNTKFNGKSQTKPSNDIQELGNRFGYLDIEEPAEVTTTGPLSSKPSKHPKTDIIYELEPSDDEISFAIFCFFKDITDIRHYVRSTWAEYREGQITLTTAAVTMNTAIAMIRRLNEEFVVNFPQFEEHGDIIDYVNYRYRDPIKDSSETVAYKTEQFEISSKIFFCNLTFQCVKHFYLGKAELPMYQTAQRSVLKLSDDEEVLFKCMSLFGFLTLKRYEALASQDEVLRGIALLKKNRKVYTLVVLAVQLFIDTRRVLGEALDRCMRDFHQMGEWISGTIQQCHEFGRTNQVNTWHKFNKEVLPEFDKNLRDLAREDFV